MSENDGSGGVLFYAVESVGIGHLSRMLGIAEAMHQVDPRLPILFAAEIPDTRLLEEYDFVAYRVPQRRPTTAQTPEARRLAAEVWEGTLRAILAAHRPALVVQDTILHPAVFALAQEHGCQQALILRVRRDLPGFLKRNSEMLARMALIAFPHRWGEVGALDLSGLAEDKVVFSGPLLRRTRSDLDLDGIRAAYGLRPDVFTLVVSNGGGNTDPRFVDDFLSLVLGAVAEIEDELPPFHVTLISGPLSEGRAPWVDLRRGRLTVREFEPRLFELMAAANLVIVRGGYNTVLEVGELGVPAICVPARRSVEDQVHRVEKAAQAHPNIHLSRLELGQLADLVRAEAGEPWWRYEPDQRQDEIAANKQALARRLLKLASTGGAGIAG